MQTLKIMSISLFFLLFSNLALANMEKAPKNFNHKDSKAVFVDFTNASYELIYDFNSSSLTIHSTIELNQPEDGRIIFDIVPTLSSIKLDDQIVEIEKISTPESASNVTIIDSISLAGVHKIQTINKVDKYLTFSSSGVASSFWLSDLNDRRYLENFFPANLEYDQVAMSFSVEFLNFPKKQLIFSNGEITEVSPNKYIITYPEYFTSSSLYFHTAYEGKFSVIKDNFNSIDGRVLPITVYTEQSSSSQRFMSAAINILNELEKDYGPFLHPQIIIYGAGMGGMEYCGATMTDFSALGHELHHSYFARGIMPANGNAGWVDEAIASWRDGGYRSRTSTGFRSTQMAGHSDYRRFTDRDAYGKGAQFMSYLDHLLADVGGLKKFIRNFKDNWHFKPFFTKDFQNSVEEYSGKDFSNEFNQYIYGLGLIKSQESKDLHNPMHPVLSDDYIQSLL